MPATGRAATLISSAVRRALLVAAVSAAGLGVAAAQTAPAQDALDTVIITGSHIKRAEIESSVPVQVLSADFLESKGVQNVVDILQELPSFGTAGYSRANSNFYSFGNGVSTVNLRNVGDQRSLVLVNGRRSVSGIGGSSTVDINNIPSDLIKSIEVITGGASAVYGSEAIAGVVNFILKDDFEGLALHTQAGMTSEKDNDRYLFSVTAGTKFLERGNIVLNVQVDKDNGLPSRNRKLSAVDNPFKSSYVPQGRFYVDDGSANGSLWTYGSNNQLKHSFSTAVDGYNRNGIRSIAVPLQRSLTTLLAGYDLTDHARAYFEGTYGQVRSRAHLEADPLDNSDAYLPDGSSYAGLTLDNPFIPAAIRADMIANENDTLSFRKRMTGIFDRSNKATRDYSHYVAGIKGDLPGDWKYDAYVSQSTSKDDTSSETGLRSRFFFALDAIAGPGGTPICRDAGARADGCVPFNPFGFNSASQASINYIRDNQFVTYLASIKQQVAAANFTGPVFTLPAGKVQVAAGVEHRKEESSEIWSAETQAGNTFGNAFSNTTGKYHVTEVYAETVVPLLADMPAVRSLDFEGAVRYGDYSTVGGVTSWKAGLTWQPIESVRLRAVYANATRAPNIGELYQGQSQTFPNNIHDPCEGTTATSAGALSTYCRGIPGVLQNIARNGGVFTYSENLDRQSIQGFDGGNPLLKAEKAKTWTAGVVFTPPAVPGLQITVDWFDIKIDDAIALVPRQYIVDQCVNSLGVSDLCHFITREGAAPVRPRGAGTLYNIDSGPINAASIVSSGVDLGVRYQYHLDDGSKLSASLQYTYLDKLAQTPIKGEEVQVNKGQLNGDGRLGAGFEHRANLTLGYSVGSLDAEWTVRYQSGIDDTLGILPADDPGNHVSAYIYNDLHANYAFGSSGWSAYVGIDNVLDKKPPLMDQTRSSNITGTETAAESYDVIGRFIYAGVRLKL
jgi:outer membrane receptor protein involved in Fe transport